MTGRGSREFRDLGDERKKVLLKSNKQRHKSRQTCLLRREPGLLPTVTLLTVRCCPPAHVSRKEGAVEVDD